ncbi:MAG: hypothetical protein ACRD8Z_28200 [Nitrososphaeraceae archaeon]
MNKTERDVFKRGPCLLCGGTTQPFADLIGHIREMHSTAHGTADLIAELMIRVSSLETLIKGKP